MGKLNSAFRKLVGRPAHDATGVAGGAPGGAAILHGRKVGLQPSRDWRKRNFVTQVLVPSLFTRRTGRTQAPAFPELREGEVGVTWIGHASFLIHTTEGNILIDPNWARWLSVIKRQRHPGLRLADLPKIDLVLVTHAHFDHLDRSALRAVADGQPIGVPFGVGSLVRRLGFHTTHELTHWEPQQIGPAKVTLTPCHHWGARLLHDSDRGFGGFVIEIAGRKIFHCGDSAYFEGFAEIGRREPGIDLALMPIGAYDPPSGREVHMNPEEAVRAFVDLGARTLIPMHYGSFRLSYEPPEEPPKRLLERARALELEDRVRILEEGRTVVF